MSSAVTSFPRPAKSPIKLVRGCPWGFPFRSDKVRARRSISCCSAGGRVERRSKISCWTVMTVILGCDRYRFNHSILRRRPRPRLIALEKHDVLPGQVIVLLDQLEAVGGDLLVDLGFAHLVEFLDWDIRIFSPKLDQHQAAGFRHALA